MKPLSFGIALLACASVAFGQTAKTARKPSPPLASLPAPKAGGALRILLVDDDANNGRGKGSQIYKKLIADAVGGDAKAWSSVAVEGNQHGPAFEKLRDFNVVVWYTGESYGGGANSVSTLSDEDEKTARRYLRETGGAFILVSPGFLATRAYGTTWTESENPFLKEVVGVTGFASLVQRFTAGTVRAPGGASFAVQAKGTVETQFSAVNPDGAAVVFSAALDPKKTAEGQVPVAVAHAFGGGRFVYVGFSLENIAEGERAKAFGVLLDAATGQRTAVAAPPAPTRTPVAQKPAAGVQTLKPSPPGPAVTNLVISNASPARHRLEWQVKGTDYPNSLEIYRRDADGWKHLASVGYVSNKGDFQWYYDLSFVAANSAYRVAAVYSDGRRGEAEVAYPNPPQPELPTGLVASQIRWDGILLKWNRLVSPQMYRVYGPGLPADGFRISHTGYQPRIWRPDFTDVGNPDPTPGANYDVLPLEKFKLPVGEHEFRVANDYTYSSSVPGTDQSQFPIRVAPISAAVRVRVAPQQPPVVTDLRVEQLGYRRIVLRWKPAANPLNGEPRVYAAAMGATDRAAVVRPGNDQWIVIREVPEGTHTIRMAYHFPYTGVGPLHAEVTTTIVNMPQTSNDIPNSVGQWVVEVNQPAVRQTQKGDAKKAGAGSTKKGG